MLEETVDVGKIVYDLYVDVCQFIDENRTNWIIARSAMYAFEYKVGHGHRATDAKTREALQVLEIDPDGFGAFKGMKPEDVYMVIH